MKILKSENVKPFDVDGTLIYYEKSSSLNNTIDILDSLTGKYITVNINKNMVRLFEEEHARGAYIVVWSRGGYRWAHDVIKALGLYKKERLLIMSKPIVYFDDNEVKDWLKDRVFMAPNIVYKE